MISNLLENAIQFSCSNKPFIKITTRKNDGNILIIVADNGQGIPPESRDRIFTMYYRANENSKGNGLGLYVVKRAVEKLGGTVSFTSGVNEGSSFELVIPV